MVDWSGKLEAVHTDGRVEAARYEGVAASPGYIVFFEGKDWFVNLGGTVCGTDWTVSNVVEQPAWRTSAEQLDRMDALVKRIRAAAGEGVRMFASDELEVVAEAKAILAAREPIDPDVAIAKQICDRSPYDLTGLNEPRVATTNEQIREAVLAGIKYGRAQA